jgi:hypothetical protein
VTNPKTSPKQVFEIKQLCLKLGRSKLNSNCLIIRIKYPNISGPSFIIRNEKIDLMENLTHLQIRGTILSNFVCRFKK